MATMNTKSLVLMSGKSLKTKAAFRLWLGTALLCLCTAAAAHRFHAAITDISINARTGNTEIIHTLMAHDVEALLTQRHQRRFDMAGAEDERLLRQYIEQQFYIATPGGRRLPLQWVGIKVDAESVIIYQETSASAVQKGVLIHNSMLIDVLHDQSNTVNLTTHGKVRTWLFGRKHIEQTLP